MQAQGTKPEDSCEHYFQWISFQADKIYSHWANSLSQNSCSLPELILDKLSFYLNYCSHIQSKQLAALSALFLHVLFSISFSCFINYTKCLPWHLLTCISFAMIIFSTHITLPHHPFHFPLVSYLFQNTLFSDLMSFEIKSWFWIWGKMWDICPSLSYFI